MNKAHPDPEGVLRHVAAMDPPGRRTISTAEAQAVLDELAAHEKDLLAVEQQRADLAERLFAQDAELAALRAVAVAAQGFCAEGDTFDVAARWMPRMRAALDAFPARDAVPAGAEGDGGENNRADCDQCGGTGCDPVAREGDNEPSLCEGCDGLGRVVRR